MLYQSDVREFYFSDDMFIARRFKYVTGVGAFVVVK